ncbi:MAG: ImmA/IrrE family metallo-endopeptidase [Planctomycetales bacterium]|nr:ImmA/IrrE family metallo-endopeptidase [Planctomycetales bacterium]
MIADLTTTEVCAAIELVVRELLWEAGIEHPPVDALEAARRLGCVVVPSEHAPHRAYRVRVASCGVRTEEVIALAPEDRPERRQWSVAHELGEAHAHRLFRYLGIGPRDCPGAAREQLANRFANCLLLPGRWFLPAALACDWDLAALKRRFATASHELIARRFLELHEGSIVVTVIDNGQQTWRRGSRWRAPPAAPCELAAWNKAFETGRYVDCPVGRDQVTRLRVWPVHEHGWRREILLTEYEEC